MKYILFLRIIRQEFVAQKDLEIAQLLINSFVEDFPFLYGTKNTTHNLHSNLHLPEQIALHGNKCNAYPGENCFKQLKPNVNGPTYITSQLARNAGIQNRVNSFLTIKEAEKMEKFELKNLYHKLNAIKNENHIYLNHSAALLVDAKPIRYEQLFPFECKLLVEFFGDTICGLDFETSEKALFKNKCKYVVLIFHII